MESTTPRREEWIQPTDIMLTSTFKWMAKVCEMLLCSLQFFNHPPEMRDINTAAHGNIPQIRTSERGRPLPGFEGCSADTIMVVAVWGPVTNDCVVAVGTSVPCGVVITNPAKRRRKTITVCVTCLSNRQRSNCQNLKTRTKLANVKPSNGSSISILHLTEQLVKAELDYFIRNIRKFL